ncbi:GYF domain-containing protein [Methyloligella sp. 2.7D]|uniref:GYF domain-containing protein n=1 Tax=unclassified Methyloligella TaxID=2625955 RepID=UPI001ABAA85B|nr:GYF domain-containing protein [Methyloligella sp. GL2]
MSDQEFGKRNQTPAVRPNPPPPHPLDRQWFVHSNGASSGPFSGHEIKQMKQDGSLSASDYLCAVGASQWSLASEEPVLGKLFAPPPPDPVAPVSGNSGTVVQVTNTVQAAPAINPDGTFGPKSPGVALLLSLLFCGAGQLYNGQVGKGILMFVGCVLLWFVFMGWAIWIWSVIDAYTTAKRLNLAYQQQMAIRTV